MKTPDHLPSGAAALLDAHPLMIKAKKWAKKLKKEIASQAHAPALNLMRAQEIVCRQLGFENLHALRSRCMSELFPSRAASLALSLWPDSRAPMDGFWRMGRSISGLSAGAHESAIAGHVLIERCASSSSSIPLSLCLEAIARGKGLSWIGKDAGEAEALHQRALDAGRLSDVRRISAYPARAGLMGERASFSRVLAGSSASITELVLGLLSESDTHGGNMWRGRAISLLSTVSMALCAARELDGGEITLEKIASHMSLDRVMGLASRRDFPSHVHAALNAYLRSLPGFQWGAQPQRESVIDQHGYLQMQFQKPLDALSGQSGLFSDDAEALDMGAMAADSTLIYIVELPEISPHSPLCPKTLALLLMGALFKSAQARFDALGATLSVPAQPPEPEASERELRRLAAIIDAPLPKGMALNMARCQSVGIALCLDVDIDHIDTDQALLSAVRAQCAARAADPIAVARAYHEPTPASAQLAPGELIFSVFCEDQRLDIVGSTPR